MALTQVNSGLLDSNAQYYGFKNRIINGAMMIDQRNAGASVTPNNSYTLDRWSGGNTQSSKYTVQQSSVAPAGFKNSLLVTSSSAYSVGSSDAFFIGQAVEGFNISDLGWGAAGAATVTLSFWVRSSLTGTFGGTLQNSGNARNYPFTYTISSANTWEQKSVTIAGDTTGTWLTNNGVGIQLFMGLGCGSTFSGTAGAWASGNIISATGATSVVGTSGATFYITGVQLEKGSTATSFDYRPYGTELALCQRYYQQINGPASGNSYVGNGMSTTATGFSVFLPFIVQMRSAPTFNYSGAGITDGANYGAGITSIIAFGASTWGARADGACSGGGMSAFRTGLVYIGNANYVSYSAEL
jgi:hypothetical protein